MKFLMTLLIICIFLPLPSNAQHRYYLAKKGDKVEYDTAVVMRTSAFKNDLISMKKKDLMIDSLMTINALYEEKYEKTIMAKQEQEEAIDKFLIDLNENPPRLKNKWYMNPVFGMGVGILIGVYLIR